MDYPKPAIVPAKRNAAQRPHPPFDLAPHRGNKCTLYHDVNAPSVAVQNLDLTAQALNPNSWAWLVIVIDKRKTTDPRLRSCHDLRVTPKGQGYQGFSLVVWVRRWHRLTLAHPLIRAKVNWWTSSPGDLEGFGKQPEAGLAPVPRLAFGRTETHLQRHAEFSGSERSHALINQTHSTGMLAFRSSA
jgi:hypothetical protein